MTIPFLRTCLLSTTLIAGGVALAQTLPNGLTRSGDVVMMQPIADAIGISGTGLSTARPNRLKFLTPPEHGLFSRAFEAGVRGDWVAARSLAAQGQNATARRLLEWRYALDKDSGATFAEIDAVIKDTDAKGAAAWPLRGTLQARAEAMIRPDMPPAAIVAWFSGRNPNSSIGKIWLGEALVATGDKARGAALIRSGWIEGSFDTATELDIAQKDAAHLTPDSDRARLNNLLWRGETIAAKRLIARVDEATAAIANARIELSAGLPKAQAALNKVSDFSDPNLLFDWSRALRLANRDSEAGAILLRTPPATLVRDRAARWWNETAIQARGALADGNPRMALSLVQHAGFSSGEQNAEQHFLAGFIALRSLTEPATALEHFRKLEAGVARPISKSRALYWQGRSLEAQGDTAAALTRYRAAAAYPETFYGQIALARTDAAPMLRLADTIVEAAAPSEVESHELCRRPHAAIHPSRDRPAPLCGPRRGTRSGTGAGVDPAGDRIRRLCHQQRRRARPDADDAGQRQGRGQAGGPALSARGAAQRHGLQHAAGHDGISRPPGPLWRLAGAGGRVLQCRAGQQP